MALSSSPRSSSSASKPAKPTPRKAAGQARVAAPKVASPKAKPARPAAKQRAVATPAQKKANPLKGLGRPKAAKPVVKPTAKPASKLSPKPVTASKPAPAPKPLAPKGAPTPSLRPSLHTPKPKPVVPGKPGRTRTLPGFLRPVVAAFAAIGHALGGLLSHIPLPKLNRGVLLGIAGGVVALILAAIVIVNSALFAATEIEVRGSAHVEQETAAKLVEVPAGTTLLNVNEGPILESLKASPWVAGVDIQREWPHKLIVTPVEHTVKAIAYITADELAWGISEQGTWIAPLSLTIALDAEGNEVALTEDGAVPEGATQMAPFDAALRLAQQAGALMLTDVPSDANPKSGEPVTSKVVLAGLEYAKGFSPEFVGQIKDLSVASLESIAADLTSGIEVSLGKPENITEKERVVTKLLEGQQGVTYINVREPGAYTFRSAPQQ